MIVDAVKNEYIFLYSLQTWTKKEKKRKEKTRKYDYERVEAVGGASHLKGSSSSVSIL